MTVLEALLFVIGIGGALGVWALVVSVADNALEYDRPTPAEVFVAAFAEHVQFRLVQEAERAERAEERADLARWADDGGPLA